MYEDSSSKLFYLNHKQAISLVGDQGFLLKTTLTTVLLLSISVKGSGATWRRNFSQIFLERIGLGYLLDRGCLPHLLSLHLEDRIFVSHCVGSLALWAGRDHGRPYCSRGPDTVRTRDNSDTGLHWRRKGSFYKLGQLAACLGTGTLTHVLTSWAS